MKRRLFNLLAGLSMVLCIATLLLWAVAQRHPICLVKLWWAIGPGNEDVDLLAQNGDAEQRAFDAEHRGRFDVPRPPLSDIPLHLEMIVRVHGFNRTGYFSEECEQISEFDNYTPPESEEPERIRGKLSSLAPSNKTTMYWAENFDFRGFVQTSNSIKRCDENCHWSFAPISECLAILPMAWFAIALFRWHHMQQERVIGLCPVCGYDLRATPDRCPECGTVPEKATVKP